MIELILNVIEKIQNNKYDNNIDIQYNCDSDNLSIMENDTNFALPNELKIIYNKFNKLYISWDNNNNRGHFELISLKEIWFTKEYFKTLATEFYLNSELSEKEKIKRDLLNWIPILHFPNGDYFCIDERTDSIVFFDHEILEDYVNLHGIKIATDFKELMIKWSKVLFLDIYDWSLGTDENGLNLSKKIFDKILSN